MLGAVDVFHAKAVAPTFQERTELRRAIVSLKELEKSDDTIYEVSF